MIRVVKKSCPICFDSVKENVGLLVQRMEQVSEIGTYFFSKVNVHIGEKRGE
ncbi:hypothetical protein QRE65_00060 (plasmid) [Bacillus cereus]|nr:hypothetical protein BWGOE6_37090 [Bacillus mycoides]WJE23058.1 hypothetical protein QRE65_00060 [Bacillus cereus]